MLIASARFDFVWGDNAAPYRDQAGRAGLLRDV
jgi:hypothetical protein